MKKSMNNQLKSVESEEVKPQPKKSKSPFVQLCELYTKIAFSTDVLVAGFGKGNTGTETLIVEEIYSNREKADLLIAKINNRITARKQV